MQHVLASDVPKLIQSSDGRIFSVEFVKRTTGECRIMQCRTGVTSYLRGGDPAYDRETAKLVCVFDVVKGGYRSIPLEGLRTVHMGGQSYIVDHV